MIHSFIEPAPGPHESQAGERRSLLRLARSGSAAFRLAAMRPKKPLRVLDPHILRTRRLVLRPLQYSDRAEFLRVIAISRSHLADSMPLHRDGESDLDLFARYLSQSQAAIATGRAWRVGAFARDDADPRHGTPRLVGLVNLNDLIRGLECQAEANWWISADSLRRGYATEAVTAVVQHAFTDLPRGLGLQRVCALVTPNNAPSLRVAGAAGFVRCPDDDTAISIAGRSVRHHAFSAFASIKTEMVREIESRPHTPLRRGLASILSTEIAARRHVLVE